MAEKFPTLHPEGKKGVNIDSAKYNQVRKTLIGILDEKPEITYQEMDKMANERLKGNFTGSISWYVVTVKLDLEARGLIERIPGTSPHQIRIKR